MPLYRQSFRQRKRSNTRVWISSHPNFLTYVYGGIVYSRTYTSTPPYVISQLETESSTKLVGFYFWPPPAPPLVPLKGSTTIGIFGTTSGGDTGITPIGNSNLMNIAEQSLNVGTTSTQIRPTPVFVRRVTILAPSSNTGVIWVSTAKNTPSGVGFPLVAGSAKDYGDIASTRLVDLSGLFVIGTNASDIVYLDLET